MILVFYDLETTGFSKEHNDIIEIAAVAWDNETNEVKDEFKQYVKPMTAIPYMITQLTGISNATVYGSNHYWDVAPQFFAWVKNWNPQAMAGYNSTVFDWPFLAAQNKRYGLDMPNFAQIDVLKIARDLKKRGLLEGADLVNLKQPTLAAHFGINYEAHDAINDVRCLVEIYRRLRALDPRLA